MIRLTKNRKHVGLATLVFIIGLIVVVVLKVTAPVSVAKPEVERRWAVATKKLYLENVQPNIQEFGAIVAGSQAEIRPLVSGRIIELGENYYEGAIVIAGELLAKIDPFTYKIKVQDSEAALQEVLNKILETEGEIKFESKLHKIAVSQLALRKKDLDRRQKLVRQGSSSRKSLDDAELAYNGVYQESIGRQQTILRLKNRLAQFRASSKRAQSSLELAKRDLKETVIYAPFGGFLANASFSRGQRIGTSERIVRLIEAKRLEVKFRISERNFSNLLVPKKEILSDNLATTELMGKKIQVRWSIGKRIFIYDAIIKRLGAEIDAAGGGIDVFAKLLGIDLMTPLRPGAFVEVNIPSRLYRDVVKVPNSALVRDKIIYLIINGRVKEKFVKPLRRGAKDMILGDKDLDGSIIITRPFPKIADGLLVKAR
ncbi:hypothetical protein OAR29_01510 [Rhodospirillales bacterium]|nr:hypothetical protein [Rhodospirillales bacterium]